MSTMNRSGLPVSRWLPTVSLVLLAAGPAAAQQPTLAGTIIDSLTGRALDGARVELRRDTAVIASAVSDARGSFSLEAPAGSYRLVVARLDYRPHIVDPLRLPPDGTSLTIVLSRRAFMFNPILVTASRAAEEKALDAPASVSVINTQEVEERPALTPVDYAYATTGMQVATTGLTQHEMVARGFGNAASGALLVLSDQRYAQVPSLRINVYNFIPVTDQDVDRIEIVRGPGSALYGPNSADGVFHIISRAPFDYTGTAITVSGGQRELLHAQLRHASAFGERFAFKVSGQYMRGRDWPYDDPAETVQRDSTIERVSGDVRLDWRPSANASVTASVGVNQALSSVELTPLGAAQARDWRSSYAQAKVRLGRFSGQAFVNVSDAGGTQLLRSGDDIVDRSQLWVAQLQHGALVGSRVNLTYGIDLQRTVPRTDGTVTGRNEYDDAIDEAGAYVHAEADLSRVARLVVALRGDYHSRLKDPILSPRAALVLRPALDQSLRITYNRAFSTPTTNQLFLDIVGGALPTPVPTFIRLVGVPKTGFTFRRDCDGGLCMRSPYTPPDLGGGQAYLPLDVTLLWPTVVQIAALRGIDLSPIPPPTASDVGTVLGQLNLGTGSFDPVTGASDLPPLKAPIHNSIELGYRGVLWDRLSVGLDVYRGWRTDFVGSEQVETPSAFFDEDDLRSYLIDVGVPAASADSLAGEIASIPAATVTPQEARDPWDILITYRNFGNVGYWGGDIELGAVVTPWLALRGTYSWVSKDQFEAVDAAGRPDTIPLNASANRAAFSIVARHDGIGLNAEVRGRWVDAFPVSSGVYVGTVDAYTVLDALAGYRLPFARRVTVTLSALNLLDSNHVEFVGAPPIGRLVMGSVRAEF
ncbi:MAG: TonB-dependent receptor [Gemmatimonadota bacterium]|nr:MAG: TonB-dependent receptor [Gemmatimonadota bacterium]